MNDQKISVTREEIEKIKAGLRRTGRSGYAKIVRIAHQKAVEPRLSLISGTSRLLRLSRILGWFYPLLILALPPAVFLMTPWWSGLALIIFLLFLVNSVHTETNLEIGARLLALNRRINLLDY
ncbi:MAG TPA: hypothetical protein VNI84_14220 [Pyrinomonadaceae bacterium]|nr:hypothetical protein [Pyrinomonadaceae bacterium]